MGKKSTTNYKRVKEVADKQDSKKTIQTYEDAKKIIDQYYVATGRNREVRYISTSSSQPRKLNSYAGTTTAI